MTKRPVTVAAFVLVGCATVLLAQAPNNLAQLGKELSARYDLVALRDGVGLVPHERGAVRLIEVRDGAVAINGELVTARELRTRLDRDADLILRITYLDLAAQRELAGDVSSRAASQTDNRNEERVETLPPRRNQSRRGDIVRFGANVTVGPDELVNGDVVAIGGSADVNGEVTGEVTVVGGSLTLGPEAVVRRDVNVVGGTLNRAPGARIEGRIEEVGFGPNVRFGNWRELRRRFRFPGMFFGGSAMLAGTLVRFTLLLLGGLVVVALGGRHVEAIADRTANEPLRAGLAGLAAEVLFVPLLLVTVVVLAVSIIGIPLLILVPFAMVLALVLMLIGFTGVAYHVGRALSVRFPAARGPYASVALGMTAILAVTLLARFVAVAGGFVWGGFVSASLTAVGYLVEYVAWTIGIGAVIMAWLGSRRATRVTPATVPASSE